MAGAHADVSKHVRAYLAVFGALFILTVVTVLVAQVDLTHTGNIGVALVIAAFKASLVAAIFMHLKWERSWWIWWAVLISVFLFAHLIALPVLTNNDDPPQVQHTMWDVRRGSKAPPAGH